MKHIHLLLAALAIAALPFFTACGPQVYTAPEAQQHIADHRLIAIAPPTVSIQGRRKDDPEMIKQAAEADVEVFQQEIYSWMLRRKKQGKIASRIDIMDPQTVNAKLAQAGWEPNSKLMTPKEMTEILGVDAVIISKFNTTKPMSEGAAAALGILVGVWGATNNTSVNMSIHDPVAGDLWNYDWTSSGTFTNSEALVDGLMRNASRKMPYVVR